MHPTYSLAWPQTGWRSVLLIVAGLSLGPVAHGAAVAPDEAQTDAGVPAPAASPAPADTPSALAAAEAPPGPDDDPHAGMGHHHGWHHPSMMASHGSEDEDEASELIRAHHAHAGGEDSTLAAIAAPPPPHWLHGIELDEAQQDKVFTILHEVAVAQRKAQRTAEQTHRQLAHLGMATDYAESNARKLSDQHAQAIAELTMLRIRTEKRILEVLTPEQRRDAAHQAARED